MAHTSTVFAILFLLLPAIALASVTSTNITRSTDPLSPELLEKTWTISASSIDKLEIQVAGNVFVDYDSSLESDDQVAAKIIMRASSSKLLQPVEALTIDNNEGLRLHYKNEQVHVEGLVTTEIRLSKPNALRSISSTNALNVVLNDNVVVSEDKEAELHFSSHGSGQLFIGSASGSFNVRSLGLIVSGDGGVQFQSSSLKITNELVVSLVGSGHVAVLAKDSLIANKVESAVAGTGKVVFQTPGFQAATIATEIVGNGDVTYQTSGICGDEKIRLAAEGSVNAASIVCKNADISILGTGEVVVQATERLSALLLLTGSVKYVNARPKSIQSSGIVLDGSIKPAEVVPSAQYTPLSPPSRAAIGVFLTVEPANNHSSPYVHTRPVVATTMRLQNLSASLPESMSALVLFEVALVAMAFTSFSVFKFQQRRIRNKYQTLLP